MAIRRPSSRAERFPEVAGNQPREKQKRPTATSSAARVLKTSSSPIGFMPLKAAI
jgi:hypothetical protein